MNYILIILLIKRLFTVSGISIDAFNANITKLIKSLKCSTAKLDELLNISVIIKKVLLLADKNEEF